MREIGKADKGARGDAQQLADDAVGPLGRLERLRQDRIIKGVAGIIDEVAVRIALHDGLTARARRGGIGGVGRSERRGGWKEGVSTCRTLWSTYHEKRNKRKMEG